MNNPQNPTRNPEIGHVQSPGPVGLVEPVSKTAATGATIVFNQPNPNNVIAAAIAGGDTMERRAEQFNQAVRPPEQK